MTRQDNYLQEEMVMMVVMMEVKVAGSREI